MSRFILLLIVGSIAVSAAGAVVANLPEGHQQTPGARLKAVQPVANDQTHESAVGDDVARIHHLDVAGVTIPVSLLPFIHCDATRASRACGRVSAMFEHYAASDVDFSTPFRPVWAIGSGFPLSIAKVEAVGMEPTPLLVMPSPETARLAADARFLTFAAGAATLGEQADLLPDAAMTLFFPPPGSAGEVIHLPPTPRGHLISPGVFKYAWASMHRAVMTRGGSSGLSPNESLSKVADEFLAESRVRPEGALWSLPVNDHVAVVTLVDGDDSRHWIAWSIADAVAGYRPGDRSVRPDGETAMTVVFDSPAHNPTGLRGYSLLRIPAANANPRGPGVVPGERIALDEWFATAERGFAALIHTDASVPGHPAYRISVDPNDLRDPTARDRVEAIAIFEGISDAKLRAVVEAYLGLPVK